MIKPLLVATLMLVSSFAFSQSDVLKQSNDLIAKKKYNSAYLLLEKADPQNDNAAILLAKEDLFLRYFITSMMHEFFALKDMETNQSVDDFRGKPGSYPMYGFKADSLLKRLISKQPDNYQLYRGLADYYYDAFIKYGDRWVIDKDTLLKQIEIDYIKANDGGVGTYMTYYELGYTYLVQGNYDDAITNFLKSIAMDHTYGNAQYNLAYAYWEKKNLQEALKYAKNSIDLYQDTVYKSDGARMTGEIYNGMKDTINAVKYYELSNTILPGNYYTLKTLLALYVNTKNPKADELTNKFYLLDPKNPTIYNDLESIYDSNTTHLIGFFEGKLPAYKNDDKVAGSLDFYIGQLCLPDNKAKAKSYLSDAKLRLSKVFDNSNQVFSAIDQLMAQTK